MKIICVIPARYASTRLPGKPLADIAGKPMVVRVYERVLNATKPAEVIAAVDDERVYEAVVKAGGKAIMTAKNHPTGTDRLAEVAQKCTDADVIINVQGDEPLIDPQIIDDLAQEFLNDEDLKMATVKTPMKEEEKAKDLAHLSLDKFTNHVNDFTFKELCVMAGAVDNLIALIEDGETFGISETQMRNCKFFLPAVKQKLIELVK